MYFSLFFCWLLLQSPNPDERIVNTSDLTFWPSAVVHDDIFAVTNLKLLHEQEGAVNIEPMMVTCPLWHAPTDTDEMPNDLFQHVVAVAVDVDGIMLAASKAALPCPPHCEGLRRTMTIAEFLATH